MKRITGTTEQISVAGETVAAFIPYPLPPREPPLTLDRSVAESLRRAEDHLQRLELASELVPSLVWFIYGFRRYVATAVHEYRHARDPYPCLRYA